MASQDMSVYERINSLILNIELNRRTIISIASESNEIRESPDTVIFFLFAKLLDVENVSVDDSTSLSNLAISGPQDNRSVGGNSINTLKEDTTASTIGLQNNIFLNDEFLRNWIKSKHYDTTNKLSDIIGNSQCSESTSTFNNILSVNDSDLVNYFIQLYSKFADNTYSLLQSHNNQETRVEAFLLLIFEIAFLLDHTILHPQPKHATILDPDVQRTVPDTDRKDILLDDNLTALETVRLNLKIFILEGYFQLALISPINKLLLSQSKISDLIIEQLTNIVNHVIQVKNKSDQIDESTLIYFQVLFKLYLLLAEVGSIDYTLFLEYLKKVIVLNDQLSKKKNVLFENSEAINMKEDVYIRFFSLLLQNFEKLNDSSNISVTHFSKLKNRETSLTPFNFLIFPKQSYVDFNNLKLSQDGFTLQMWVQFTCRNDGTFEAHDIGGYELVDSIANRPFPGALPNTSLLSFTSISSNPSSGACANALPFVNLINCKKQVFWQLALDKKENVIVLQVKDSNGFTAQRKFTNFTLEFNSSDSIQDEPSDSASETNIEKGRSGSLFCKTKFYNIVIIHKLNSHGKDKFKPSKVHLIVDGQFTQSVSVPISSIQTYKSDISVRFGNLSSSTKTNSKPSQESLVNDTSLSGQTDDQSYVSFNNLLLINKIQPHQWIILNYFLGYNYHHNYKDLNLINKFLGYKTLTLFELKSKELKLNYDQGMSEGKEFEDNYESMNTNLLNQSLKSDNTGLLNKSFGNFQKKPHAEKSIAFNLNFVLVGDDSILLNFHARNVVHDKQKLGIKLASKSNQDELISSKFVSFDGSNPSSNRTSLMSKKQAGSYILNTVFNSVNNLEVNSRFFGEINASGKIINYQSNSNTLFNFFNSVDGITVILKLIESINADTDDSNELKVNQERLVILLRMLISLISHNHVFAREMEEKAGYHILSIILKNKKKLCVLKVLDTILDFVGYDHENPVESVIDNSVAYKSLIVDFDIWKDTDKETFKFLLFQFTVFSQDSKYHEYNVNKIVKMKIIKRFVQCLKSNVFTEEFLPSVSNTLLILIKSNPTTEIFYSLSTYIIYALQINKNFTTDPNLVPLDNPELQRKCGICILELLVHIVSNSPSQFIFRKIVKSITVRWILLLMDDTSDDIVKISLKLLIRMFSMLGPNFYSNFIQNNGFKILKNLLKKWYNDDELIVIIFAAAFGASQLDSLGTDIYEYSRRLARRNYSLRVSMPEFLYLIFDLIENSIETNNDKHHTYDVGSYERFINCVQFGFNHLNCLHVAFKKKQWISKMCLIVYKLEVQGAHEMNLVLQEFKSILASIISSVLFGSDSFMTIEHCQADMLSKKVLTGVIYPIVLKEVKTAIENDDARLRKKTVCKNICKFLLQCADSTNKFIWERPDLLSLHLTLSTFIEKYSNRYESTSSTLKALKRYLGMLTLERMFILVYALTEENRAELKELVNTLLYNQEMYFSKDALDSKKLCILVVFLLQAVKEDTVRAHSSNIMNALRIVFMYRQQDFDRVSQQINSSANEQILRFFESLLVTSDEMIIERLATDRFLKDSLEKTLFDSFEKFENTFFNVMSIKDVLRALPKSTEIEALEVKLFINFRTENVNWKSAIISSELAKYYRHFQDQQDNFQFFISNFNKMKLEVSRIFKLKSQLKCGVDNIEGLDRIRKRIVPKDDLSFEDQLLYKIEVPIVKGSTTQDKPVKEPSTLDNTLTTQIELLSADEAGNEEEGFELVDEAALFDNTQEDKNRKVLRSLFVGDRINDLWNVSQLLGLEAEEGILILGETHLYLIENYFHCSNDEVVDIDDAPADSRDPYLQLITGQPKSKNLKKSVKTHNTKSWELEKLTSVSKRQFLLRDVAIEFFFANGSSFLIICRSSKERDTIHNKFSSRAKNSNIDSDLLSALKSANYSPANTVATQNNSSFAIKLANAITSNLNGFLSITKKWKAGKISNFYYLMIVNTIAGRTFNDLTQYPVFPWVIADYTSKELDFNNPKTFRDLSKPMGAQNNKRAHQFKERYEALESLNDANAPPFHYGTHYSSAMIVTSFLIRLEPYVQSYLLLQGGKFDHADRLFYSIEKAWNSASKDNYADVRELIPEFFCLPEFLTNSNNFELGKLQSGDTISNVILPPWANNDPKIFIQKQREALESSYVSAHLHEWIDLVFGCKQKGQSAIDAKNVFHHLSYHGAINLDDIDDEIELRAMTGIIHNFGQTPLQIFSKPHPQRDVVQCPSLEVFRLSDIPTIEKSVKLPVSRIELGLKTSNSGLSWKGRVKLFSTEDNLRIQGGFSQSSLSVNGRIFESLHPGDIQVLVPIGERSFITGSDDGTINVWKFPVRASKFITFNNSPILSQLKFQEELEYKNTLRGHLSPIVDIKVSRAFNVAVSLDSLGVVYVWDLVRSKFIREVAVSNHQERIKHINVSNTTGIIAVASDYYLSLHTINSEFIASEPLKEKITSISFPDKKKPVINSFDQVKFEETHEFWLDNQIILVCTARGVAIYSLKLIDSGWNIHLIANFKVRDKDGDVVNDNSFITCVEMNLKSAVDEKGNVYGTGEIAAGDSNGNMILWS